MSFDLALQNGNIDLDVNGHRETGDVAYERDFAVRLTLDDERIVRIVVMPGAHRLRRAPIPRRR